MARTDVYIPISAAEQSSVEYDFDIHICVRLLRCSLSTVTGNAKALKRRERVVEKAPHAFFLSYRKYFLPHCGAWEE
ncbi:MAG: hypothetical protein K2H18_00910 [Muribaculaceae bacterium]|nr:hypothetical protein [Muribaculaceae bacterium]